jgi:hypothetical protein
MDSGTGLWWGVGRKGLRVYWMNSSSVTATNYLICYCL